MLGNHCATFSAVVLVVIILQLCTTTEGMTTLFRNWEQCYYEDAVPWVHIKSAHLQIVQSREHQLGAQFWVDAELLQPIVNGTVKWQIWHENTGNRQYFPAQDVCCGLLGTSQCPGESACPIEEGPAVFMQEALIDEVAGHFEAALTVKAPDVRPIRGSSGELEEVACVLVKFRLQEHELDQFAAERSK
eukprot:CAMPEP_0114633418 /NCGR_PEP_ID=MMETSP0168-20121206/15445_1 /TAXON_ID=95228 ORGANISM="Vannella sp., Strain DIVA3 517/6/12" /NCGR_SAMPLE_ID=MMETSP0168 /ASSEMBLY_ACC=CAM_ASM_000044 /LENGTH=188 /DNA_ID=CAMNT_0001845069 /DNA_START=1 /DNA_END=564 /DNA_ORIENTATION=-